MNKAIIAASLIFLSISGAQAQEDSYGDRGGKHGGKHRGDPLAHLTTELDLNEDQAVEVGAILEASRAQHRAIQQSVRDQHCAIRQTTFNELATVLSEEQMARFEDLQSQRKNRGGKHGMPKSGNCET